MAYTRTLNHIIFRTKFNISAISREYENELFAYIAGFHKNKKSKLYCINGMPEHLHLCTDLHSTLSLANFMRELKVSTSKWMYKNQNKFPFFRGWGTGYAAFSYSKNDLQNIINYIKNQKTHHQKEKFVDEYKRLIGENGLEIDYKYFLVD